MVGKKEGVKLIFLIYDFLLIVRTFEFKRHLIHPLAVVTVHTKETRGPAIIGRSLLNYNPKPVVPLISSKNIKVQKEQKKISS